jgi:triacylglycerol lipase
MGFAVRTLDAAVAPELGDILPVFSRVAGPIEELSFLRRSLLLAELSQICYLSRAEAGRLAYKMGFPEIRYYDRDGAQSYIFGNDHDRVVVCRGTEPNDWNDIRADLDLATVIAETAGRVHRGFKREVDDLWPRLEQALKNNHLPLWFTGHSLGGAMATICASRCQISYIQSNPRSLYTYGSPRVGNRQYINFVSYEAYRWVNNNDIVTRVPPWWLGYRHKGQELYLDSRGEIQRLTTWQRMKDRWRGFLGGLAKWEFDHFTDHSITRYVEYIQRAVEREESFDHKILSFRRPQLPPARHQQPTPEQRRAA